MFRLAWRPRVPSNQLPPLFTLLSPPLISIYYIPLSSNAYPAPSGWRHAQDASGVKLPRTPFPLSPSYSYIALRRALLFFSLFFPSVPLSLMLGHANSIRLLLRNRVSRLLEIFFAKKRKK